MNYDIKPKIQAILDDFTNTDDCLDNPYADFISDIVNQFNEASLSEFDAYTREIYQELLDDDSISEDNPKITYLYQILTAIYEHKLQINKTTESEETEQSLESNSNQPFQWDIARRYFNANKEKTKLSRTEGLTDFSYIKVGNDIFVLAKKLGEGAFGRVKESRQDDTEIDVINQQGEPLVIKIIISNPNLNPKDEQRTINNEIAALKKMGELKANTIREAQDGEHRKYYILAKKHEGKDLLTLLETENLSEQQKLQIAYLCAKRLKEAHANGLLHLDVKPENFIVKINRTTNQSGDEEIQIEDVNLIDWGLSEELAETQSHVSLSHPKGTPGYMAPEIHHHKASRSSDIFSLGMMLANDLMVNNQTDLIHFDYHKRITLSQVMQRMVNELKTYSERDTDSYIEDIISNHIDSQEQEPTISSTDPYQDPVLEVIDILNETGTKRMSEVFEMDFEDQHIIMNWYKSLSEMRHLLENIKKVSNDKEMSYEQKLNNIKALVKHYSRNSSEEWSIPPQEMQNIKSLLKKGFTNANEATSSNSESGLDSAFEASPPRSQEFFTPQALSPLGSPTSVSPKATVIAQQEISRPVTPGFNNLRTSAVNKATVPWALTDFNYELKALIGKSIYSSKDQYQEEINNLLDIVKKTKNTNNLQAKFYLKSTLEKHVRDLDQFMNTIKNAVHSACHDELVMNANKVILHIGKIQDAFVKDLCNGNPQLPMKDTIVANSKLYKLCEERKAQLNDFVAKVNSQQPVQAKKYFTICPR